MEHAFDEVFAKYAGQVTASTRVKHADGVVESVKYAVAPTGVVTDDASFADASKFGVTLTQNGKSRSGAKNAKRLKDLAGIAAVDAVRKLFCLESTAAQRVREEKEAAEKELAEKESLHNRVEKELAGTKNGKK